MERSLEMHSLMVSIDSKIDDLVLSKLKDTLSPEEFKEFQEKWFKLNMYRRYYQDCIELGLERLDWERLHSEGLLCKWAYENIPEIKALGFTKTTAET